MATISAFHPVQQTWQNLPPATVGDIAQVNILIELRVLSQLIILLSQGLPIKDDLQKLRVDESNSPV